MVKKNMIIKEYKLIFERLEGIKNQLIHCDTELEALKKKYKKGVADIEDNFAEAYKNIEVKIERTRAIIDIAKTHTTILRDSISAIPYDQGKLARLAVQINSGIKDDPFATELYHEATGQMVGLRAEKDALFKLSTFRKDNEASKIDGNERKIAHQSEVLKNELVSYLHSDVVGNFVQNIKSIHESFSNEVILKDIIESGQLVIGFSKMPIPVGNGCETAYQEVFGQYFDLAEQSVLVPLDISVKCGNTVVVDYTNENESIILSGIQNIIINYGRLFINSCPRVYFIDPVRLNSSALGELSVLCGDKTSLIDQVPSDMNGIKKSIDSVIVQFNSIEMMEEISLKKQNEMMLIFHDFPHGYDSTMISQIQQLCVNAKYYGITIILTTNISLQNHTDLNLIKYIKTNSIFVSEKDYCDNIENKTYKFRWLTFKDTIPSDIRNKYIEKREVIDKSNIYEQRVGLGSITEFQKGNRQLKDIPFGIDRNGEIQMLDFENSNFATFICGASRSGKSTLLHTLITGIIKNTHPDDVEMWLIDFKMTEFSRYIDNRPPHVRYIMLDESPELVYDIINRLTEILQKRQNIFKGKWQKLSEVPKEKYMPSIIVIIDEFSVMSQIVADSIMNSKDNYSVKLQALLAKGAALGLHFIFASQGFTSGTRGLNDFSKKQIQQRIAMKTEFNEIRETLDLKTASDEDKAIMEQLPVYHTLTRIPVDSRGNHLKLSNVMYISDYSNQNKMIVSMWDAIEATPKFDPYDNRKYIDKKAVIIDGNVYESFISKKNDFLVYLDNRREYLADSESAFIFLGEPRRMVKVAPIEVCKGFCENILMISPNNERMPATSIVFSLQESLALQNIETEVWANRRNAIYKQYINGHKDRAYFIVKDLESICERILKIKSLIQQKIETNTYIVLMGFESILMDMMYLDDTITTKTQKSEFLLSSINIEPRKSGDLDILSLLDAAERGEYIPDVEENESSLESEEEKRPFEGESAGNVYDAREDLKYILTHGPNLGYHFIMMFGSSGEVKQSKIDVSLFKHKILFRMARQEAMDIINASESSIISELDDRTFRYTNGIDSVSYRPYLHKGVNWDGWSLGDSGEIDSFEEEDEYLL